MRCYDVCAAKRENIDNRMKYPTKNGPGVALQFGGKAGRLAPQAPPEAGVSERYASTQSTAAEVTVAAPRPSLSR